MEKISVIIPVYNVEAYIEKCITSILNQTYPLFEVILVDDGSKDKSAQICRSFEKKDERIKVISQKNRGAGAARNTGIRQITGDFVCFLDSDDYIHPQMFELLLSQMDENIDIVECEYVPTNNDDRFKQECIDTSRIKAHVFNTEEAMREHILDHYFRQLIWNKLYRYQVVKNVFFPEGKKIDDEYWTYEVLGRAKKLKHIDVSLYAYRQQPNSVMHLLTSEQRFQSIEAKEKRIEFLKSNMPSLLPCAIANIWNTCLYQGQLVLRYDDCSKTKVISELEDILRRYPVGKLEKTSLSLKSRFWFQLAKISFGTTCRIRNQLKIGL